MTIVIFSHAVICHMQYKAILVFVTILVNCMPWKKLGWKLSKFAICLNYLKLLKGIIRSQLRYIAQVGTPYHKPFACHKVL